MTTTLRRAVGLLAAALALVLGLSALTSAAEAYPPGQHATITLSSSRVDHGATVTISGTNFRPSARVSITVDCRSHDPEKRYTVSYTAKASGGSFSQAITITPSFPNGRCIVSASTGKRAENSDRATFFVNVPGHTPQVADQARLAGFSSNTVTGSGSGLGALLVAGFGAMFLLSGGALLFLSRRRLAVVRS